MNSRTTRRWPLTLTLVALVAGASSGLVACDKTVSKNKTTTTKTTDTPEGKKTTTETTEKKVETEKK